MDKKNSEIKTSKSIQNKGVFPFLFFILFGLVYLAYFMVIQKDLMANIPAETLAIFEWNNILALFIKNPILIWLIWFVMWFLSMIATYLLSIVKLLWLRKCNVCNPIIFVITHSVWAGFGRRLLYREPSYTEIAVVIINLIWKPAFYIWTWAVAICALWFVLSIVFYIFKKNK